MSQDGQDFQIGLAENPAEAWPYLRLYDGDVGDLTDRPNYSQYIDRKPVCIRDFSRQGLQIEISNAGLAASDLIVLEYQLVYCSLGSHRPKDGFQISHAGEFSSAPIDLLQTLAYVPPQASIWLNIVFPDNPGDWLRNLYFRARVMTLWAEKPPKKDWDFATDPRVTEAHLAFPP